MFGPLDFPLMCCGRLKERQRAPITPLPLAMSQLPVGNPMWKPLSSSCWRTF